MLDYWWYLSQTGTFLCFFLLSQFHLSFFTFSFPGNPKKLLVDLHFFGISPSIFLQAILLYFSSFRWIISSLDVLSSFFPIILCSSSLLPPIWSIFVHLPLFLSFQLTFLVCASQRLNSLFPPSNSLIIIVCSWGCHPVLQDHSL